MSKSFNAILTAVFIVLILLVAGFAAGRWFVPFETKRTIATTGECLSKVEKDTTSIDLRVTVLAPAGAASLRSAQDTYAELSKYLKGVKDDTLKIQTIRFDSNERTEWNPATQRSESKGFETNIAVSVSSKNRNTIENIIGDASAIMNVFPENLRMSTSPEKMKPALEACIQTAVENARDKANAIATADGERVGQIISAEFNRTAGANDYAPRPMMLMRASAAAAPAPELFTSDSDISVSVAVTFKVK
ncbi:MAG: SIMPL domain-containing protein [Proteobacteria bacterium]|nr:SIMPL domain-containing protein [Pseudomonadota bacterium]